jgi:hypothetical protein
MIIFSFIVILVMHRQSIYYFPEIAAAQQPALLRMPARAAAARLGRPEDKSGLPYGPEVDEAGSATVGIASGQPRILYPGIPHGIEKLPCVVLAGMNSMNRLYLLVVHLAQGEQPDHCASEKLLSARWRI